MESEQSTVTSAEVSNRLKEDYEVSVIIGANQMALEKEDRCLKRSIELEKLGQDIWSSCNKCDMENNITLNKSTFCQRCGTLLTDRHY